MSRPSYEKFSDIIQVKDSNNNVYLLDDEYPVYDYERSSNDTNDYLIFTSDSSVVRRGFQLRQTPRSKHFTIIYYSEENI